MMRYLTPKTVIGTLILTLLLGVISSGLWDLLFKPGLTEFGRVLLTTVTLGSESIRDSAYASAALDPTPLPALLGVLLVCWLPVLIASGLIGGVIGRWNAERSFESAEKKVSGDMEKLIELLESRKRRLKRLLTLLGWIFLLVIGATSLTVGSIMNQSVAIWRVFHANLAICAPHIAASEEEQFLARFSSVSTRQDYMAVARDLEKIAEKNGVKLVGGQLW